MKIQLLSLLVAIFSFFSIAIAQSSPPPPLADSNYHENILYVKIKDSCELTFLTFDSLSGIDTAALIVGGINFNYFDISRIEKAFESLGETNDRLFRIYTFYFADNNQKQALIDSLLKLSCIEYAERVPKRYSFYTPSDIGPQSGSGNQWYLYKIKAEEAWDVHHGNNGGALLAKIAVIDDAIWLDHPELTNSIYLNSADPIDGIDNDKNGFKDDYRGWDVANRDNDVNPPAVLPSGEHFSHGTHVAAIAGAQTDVGSPGMASIGFGVKIIPVKIGLDATAKLTNGVGGVQYAIKAGADVICMSWGGPGYSSAEEEVLKDARARGIVLVVASGNDDTNEPMYPASYPCVIGVSATDENDEKASFSNYSTFIDVCAPGTGIYSALYDPANTNIYGNLDGTSMAAPQVAGLCGLMLLYNQDLTPDAIESCIKNNCDNIYPVNPSYIEELGSGRINAEKAMKCLQTAPVLDFSSNFQTTCKGKDVKFTCKFTSGKNNAAYNWSFPGGVPSTSSSANPIVYYPNAGMYNVSLVVTNATGSTTVTKNSYITVKNAFGNYNYGVNVDNNWMMFKGLALKFPLSSASSPQFIMEGIQHNGDEGGASISNYNGQLLFYTNGYGVYNRHHQVMSNGAALITNHPESAINTISQSAIIVPNPGDCSSLYYLFHLTPTELMYSVVDMDGDNGLGSVTQKGVRVGGVFNPSEKMTAIMHCNGKDVWVIVHEMGSSVFRSYLVTAAGVSSAPVLSPVGFTHPNIHGGQLKGSPGGDKIVMTVGGYNAGLSQLFDFDKASGKVSNAITFNTSTLTIAQRDNYGVEFSADGTKVYLTGSALVQYDLNGFSSGTIPTKLALNTSAGNDYGGVLELGPDGKIYATKTVSTLNRYTKLDVINDPDKAGSLCNLSVDGLPLQNSNGTNSFRWSMNNSFISKTLNYRKALHKTVYKVPLCNGNSATLDAGPGSVYEWEGGQTTRKIVITQPGDYLVVVTDAKGCKTQVVFVVFIDNTVLDLGPDISYQCGQPLSIVLDAGASFISYKWSTGATASSIIVTQPGLYTVEVTTLGGCKLKDQILVLPNTQFVITPYTYTCGSGPLDLNSIPLNPCPVIAGGTVSSWVQGSNGALITGPVTPTGNINYKRDYKDANGCIYCMEIIDVTFNQAQTVLNTISLACEGDNIFLNPISTPPCDNATAWELFYPDGTSTYMTSPAAISAPARNGDFFKIRSYTPDGCYCEVSTAVLSFGPTIHKETIYINCGETVDLNTYGSAACPNASYTWGAAPDEPLLSYIVEPHITTTYYRKSLNMFGCPDCIVELTVVVRTAAFPIYNVTINCGESIDLSTIADCGMPGDYLWYDNTGGVGALNQDVFSPSQSKTYYRYNLNGCPCPIEINVNIIDIPTQTITLAPPNCYGKPFNFKSLCPAAAGAIYKLIDPWEVETISSSPDFVVTLIDPGLYTVITTYPNGCKCTTEYINNLPEPTKFHNPGFISFCEGITTIRPNLGCVGATYYKWFSGDFFTSVYSANGSLTLAQRNTLHMNPDTDLNPHDQHTIKRAGYDANGCIICLEEYDIGDGPATGSTLHYTKTARMCPGDCVTFNIFQQLFPDLHDCQFTVTQDNSNATVTTAADGTITVCVSATFPHPGYNLSFQCSIAENACPIRIGLNVIAGNCKTGGPEEDPAAIGSSASYNINIFPNPTTGNITVDMKGSGDKEKTISVFDMLGRRIIHAVTTDQQQEFDLSEFSKGVYVIRVNEDKHTYTQKIILK